MKVLILFFCIILTACVSTNPQVASEASESVEGTDLYPVYDTQFDRFFIKHANALDGYNAVYFNTLALDSLEVDQGRLRLGQRNWKFSDREKQRLAEMFEKRMLRIFNESGKYALADAPGENVLAIKFELVKFIPNASKDDGLNRGVRDKVLTRSVGDLDMVVRIEDSLSGELVAWLEDSDDVGDSIDFEENDRFNNNRKIRLTMEKWLTRLKNALETIKA